MIAVEQVEAIGYSRNEPGEHSFHMSPYSEQTARSSAGGRVKRRLQPPNGDQHRLGVACMQPMRSSKLGSSGTPSPTHSGTSMTLA